MNNEIEISPDYKNLTLEIEALTKEYALVWEEKERLENQVKPVLLVKYNLEIGQYILLYLNKHLYLLQLKRKIELLQMHINQNKRVEMSEVEEILEQEFKEWTNKIFDLEKDIQTARKTTFELVNEEEAIKIQEIYRKLVRILHPDLNKNLTERQKILWNRLQTAYKNFDLQELKNLEILAESEESISEVSNLEVLKQRKEALWKQYQILTKTLLEVKSNFPLSLETELNDPIWIQTEAEIYQKKVKEIDAVLPEYEKIYQSILLQLYGSMEEHPENL